MKKYLNNSNVYKRLFWLRAIGWLMVLLVSILSLISLPQTNIPIHNSDKWLHLITYFALAYWFSHVYSRSAIKVVLGFVALGLVLEVLQNLTPHRYFEWLDMLMNITGVVSAWVTFWPLKLRIKFITS